MGDLLSGLRAIPFPHGASGCSDFVTASRKQELPNVVQLVTFRSCSGFSFQPSNAWRCCGCGVNKSRNLTPFNTSVPCLNSFRLDEQSFHSRHQPQKIVMPALQETQIAVLFTASTPLIQGHIWKTITFAECSSSSK